MGTKYALGRIWPSAVLGVEHAEQAGRAAVELEEPEAERSAADEAAPELADEGGAEEGRGVVWREAEEDLFHELLRHLRQRRRHIYACLSLAVARFWWNAAEQIDRTN